MYLIEDAARRKAADGALGLSEHRYSALFENMQDSFAYHKILLDEAGKPVDICGFYQMKHRTA